ncbi:MAG TPA: hypothetical protein VK558_13595, partial [Patescibacteria group bacterium]|nr:hypothetical protein [Patescibacteria group bacterium]
EVVRLFHPVEIQQHGLELVNNSAEDIDAAVAQMLDRLSGTPDPEADAALNAAYAAIRDRHWLETGATIGSHFLRRHAALFDEAVP